MKYFSTYSLKKKKNSNSTKQKCFHLIQNCFYIELFFIIEKISPEAKQLQKICHKIYFLFRPQCGQFIHHYTTGNLISSFRLTIIRSKVLDMSVHIFLLLTCLQHVQIKDAECIYEKNWCWLNQEDKTDWWSCRCHNTMLRMQIPYMVPKQTQWQKS